jgi:hypothetical protein
MWRALLRIERRLPENVRRRLSSILARLREERTPRSRAMIPMNRAYTLAAAAVRCRLAEQRPDDLAILDSLTAADVSVYKGTYDSVENVLDRLGVPYTMNPDPRRAGRVVFANCSKERDPKLLRHIEPHVRDGAWLVSSDWSLSNVVQRAFPDSIRYNGATKSRDEVVAVEPALDSVWSDVVVLGVDPQWWLECGSQPIEILNRERVRVEAASHEMLLRFDAPEVAVRFDWERGHVYHVVSHFWLKRSRMPDERYKRPVAEFLTAGLRLSDESAARVIDDAQVLTKDLNFAMIQSAAMATELVAHLCVQSRRAYAN